MRKFRVQRVGVENMNQLENIKLGKIHSDEFDELCKKPKMRRKSFRITASLVGAIAPVTLSVFILLSAMQQFVALKAQDDVPALEFEVHPHSRRLLQSPTNTIELACAATRYPSSCLAALLADTRAPSASAQDLVTILTSISKQRSLSAISDGETLSTLAPTAANVNLTSVSAQCSEVLDLASHLLQNSENAFAGLLLKDIQAWLSATLTYTNDCYYALTPFRLTLIFIREMEDRLNTTVELISDALALTNALVNYGHDATLWKPPPESRTDETIAYTDVFPNWLGDADKARLSNATSPENLLADLIPSTIVSLDSLRTSIQAAVDQAPSWSLERYVIYIKAGIYDEIVRIPKDKVNLMFVGDGIGLTIITGNMNAQQVGMTTWLSPTVAVNGAGFIAKGITFENTAGPEAHQAVALRVGSDRSAFQSCSIVGYQDSLFAHTLRQFYKDCTISGTIDFVFGNSAAIFQNCNFVVRVGRPGATTNMLTAQGRTDPGQNTALVFQNCSVTGTPEYEELYQSDPSLHLYLGRPWKMFSRTIFIYTYLSQIVHPQGWLPWNGTFALATLLDGEHGSYGPGSSDLSQRVPWSNQLSLAQVQAYSAQAFLQADTWLPATMVPYVPLV